MLGYIALGLACLGLLILLARWFVAIPAGDLVQALRTFVAVFTALASTGLLLSGRIGLAVVTLAATVMAVRSLVANRSTGPRGDAGQPGTSAVETRLLHMELDHASGEVEGRVKAGAFAGEMLSALGLSDLLALLEEAHREDPRAVPLLEAYLDRRAPDWRARAHAGGQASAAPDAAAMDERTALEILGLKPGATADEIRAAHRRLMAQIHPDRGGSDYLASQINRARDFLLHARR